ncbi:MAG TPA: DUF4157 domain-containing protein [Nostocaceae cyanobacterium]|nr:DUF4157 domain-containing protein [Nostocaceae cyanobacterium]
MAYQWGKKNNSHSNTSDQDRPNQFASRPFIFRPEQEQKPQEPRPISDGSSSQLRLSSITRPDPTVQPQPTLQLDTEQETEEQKQESKNTIKQQDSGNPEQPNSNNASNPTATIQTKLTIGEPGDKYEQEADAVAQKVMSGNTLQLSYWPEKTTPKNPLPILQRKLLNTENINSQIQRKSSESTDQEKPDLEHQLNSKKGGGSPLDSNTRSFMESRFGADFSSVRVHTDSTAVQMNRELGAQAFTHGNDIFFRDGKTPGKNELTAHELTHVIQQTGTVQKKPSIEIQNDTESKEKNPELINSSPEVSSENITVSEHLESFGVQRLCSECASKLEKEENTIQAKEIPGLTPKISHNQNLLQLRSQETQTSTIKTQENNQQSNQLTANNSQSQSSTENLTQQNQTTSLNSSEKTNSNSQESTANTSSSASVAATETAENSQKPGENTEQTTSSGTEAETGKEGENVASEAVEIPPQVPQTETQDAAATPTSETSPIAEKMQEQAGAEAIQLPPEAGKPDGQEQGKENSKAEGELAQVPEAQALEQAVTQNQEATEGQKTGGDPATQTATAEAEKAQGEAQAGEAQLAATNSQATQLASAGVSFGAPEPEEGNADIVIARKSEPGGEGLAFLEQQRAAASNQASAFLASAAAKVQTITGLGQNIPARILAVKESAKASVLAAVEQQKAAVTAQIAQLKAQVQAEAQTALTQIQTQQQTALATISQTTANARTQLEGEFTNANTALSEKENSQIAKIEQLYQQALPQYQAAGERVGNEAIAQAENRAQGYESLITGRDDSLLDGPLTDNRNRARAKAAREVGKQYQQGLIEEANKQAQQAQEGKSKDIDAVRQIANQSRETLQTQHQANLESLTTSEQQAQTQVEQAQTSLTAAANQTLEATLQSLDQKEQSQQQVLTEYGQQQVTAIEGNAQKVIAGLQQGINQAATSLQAALQNFQAQAQGMAAPDPAALAASLAQAGGQIDGAIAQVQTQLETHLGTAEQGLTQAGQQALTSLTTIGEGGVQEAQTVATGLTTSLQQLNDSANQTFSQLQEGYNSTVQSTTQTAISGFAQVTQGIDTAFNQTNQNLEQGISNSVTQIETGLRGGLDQMNADIDKYAEEAAAQEQPRWKGVLKVLLVIAVIVVVALVVGPAVIGAVGAMAGALGASAATAGAIGAIVGGAIVGAASGAVIQMGNNIIDGKNLMEGVGQAALVGAIGGALGGAGGLVANRIAGTGVTQVLQRFGIETGFDVVGNILGDLASGNPITFENLLTSTLQGIGMSLAMGGAGRLRAVEATQTRFSDLGASFGSAAGTGIRSGLSGGVDVPTTTRPNIDTPSVRQPEVPRPDVDTPNSRPPEVEANTPRTDTPSVRQPEVEANTPRTDTPNSRPPEVEANTPRTDTPNSRPPEVEANTPRTDTPNRPTAHTNEPEVEPGVVAKERTASGHEVKVLKDGSIAICSVCGKLRNRYSEELTRRPDLAKELDEAELLANPREKAKRAKEIEAKLTAERLNRIDEPITPEHYEVLRRSTPNDSIRKMVNKVRGDKVDPVYGYKVDNLEADHIVSMKTITEMEGFSRLSTDNQLKVLNNPENFMGLGKSSNASKQDKSWAEWEGHSELGSIPPEFKARMIGEEQRVQSLLESQIQTLLNQQISSP